MKRLFNCKKLNNKGMTLIEVMVAVIILSLVGGVLLQSFSTSAKVNRDAKEKQQAMVLAQSLMEGFKSYDTNELQVQFSSVPNNQFKLYELGSSSTKSYSTDLSNNKFFDLTNIQFDGKAYDVKVKLSPTSSTAPFVKISDSNVYKDAIFRELNEADYSGFQDVVVNTLLALGAKPLAPGTEYQLAGVTTVNGRQTTVTISANTVSVGVEYTFTINNLEYTKVDPVTLTESPEYYSGTLTHTYTYMTAYGQSYDNTVTGATLENVYLYYYPLYKVPSHMQCAEDKLIIQNNSGDTKNVYLIKQKSGTLSDATINSGEALYKLKVNASGGAVNVYHNIDQKFGTTGNPDIELTGAATDMGSPWDKPAANPTVLLYNVEIDIYKTGDSTSIHRLTGTVNVQ